MIDYQFNNHNLKQHRQSLRNAMPQPEAILWSKLRASQLYGYKFRRQYGIGKYIVDFYCPKARLVVEIDGNSHYQNDVREKDKEREGFIKSFNISIVRFTNKDITENLTGVLKKLADFVKTIETTTP